jgi:hypothetical protein
MRKVTEMKNSKEIIKWIESYDSEKYPTGIYDELVVEGRKCEDKMSLMGAWKTGSLRVDSVGKEYQDANGNGYGYTNRWKASAPVGYVIWNEISRNQEYFKELIPEDFPMKMPLIVKELLSRNGFGFIWTLFVLHCFYPRIYPLYDQHVYRAYKYMVSNGRITTGMAPNSWEKYIDYKKFFDNMLFELDIEFWELDRGLWSYGKALKQRNGLTKKHVEYKTVPTELIDHEVHVEPIPGMPVKIMDRSIFSNVIPTVCGLKNMLKKLIAAGGDVSKLKAWEKSCYKAYNIEDVKMNIIKAEEAEWPKVIRNHLLIGDKTLFGANCVDIYLVGYVANEFRVGKSYFKTFIMENGITDKEHSFNAIWNVGKGDGVYLDVLKSDGSIKDSEFFRKWIER